MVPCGQCEDCLRRKITDWANRIGSMFKDYHFIFCTLTYAPQYVKHNSYGDMIVSREDVRLFLHRLRADLRRVYNCVGLKHFICSEYSPVKLRPHYHCIFFIPKVWSLPLQSYKAIIYNSWGMCMKDSQDFHILGSNIRYTGTKDEQAAKVARYVSKYFTYGKFIPKSLDDKCNDKFTAYWNHFLTNCSSAVIDLQFEDGYKRLEVVQDEMYKKFRKSEFPGSFLFSSQGIGEALCDPALFAAWEGYMLQAFTALHNGDYIDLPILWHYLNMISIRVGYEPRTISVPKYVRERFKSDTCLGHHYSDLIRELVNLNLIKQYNDIDSSLIEVDNIYSRHDYLEYVRGHNPQL